MPDFQRNQSGLNDEALKKEKIGAYYSATDFKVLNK